MPSPFSLRAKELLDSYMATAMPEKKHLGVSFGLYESGNTHFWNYGHTDLECQREIRETDIFEIASLTKIFTAILFAKFFTEGLCGPQDQVSQCLPELPFGDTVSITDLLTHQAGLSREPPNFVSLAPQNSFASFGDSQLFEALRGLEKLPGPKSIAYSNFGYVLLGLIAKRLTGKDDFSKLCQNAVIDPLGLVDTRFHLKNHQKDRSFPGWTPDSKSVRYEIYNAFESAGGVKSSVHDLIKLSSRILKKSFPNEDFKDAIERTLQIVPDQAGTQIASAWHIRRHGEILTFYHPGGIAGVKSAVLLSPTLDRAIAYISNTENHIRAIWDILLPPWRNTKPIRRYAIAKYHATTIKPPSIRRF